MRTKAMYLAAALTALGSAAVMAQTNVYSLNAVGYINVTLYPGFTMIADQLESGTNTINNLFPNTGGAFDHFQVYKWTGSGFQTDTGSHLLGGWQNGGVITFNPGEAAWIKNPTVNPVTNTFVGTVPQGTLTVNIAGAGAFSMISSVVPQGGDLVTNLGFTNFNNKDQIYVYNSSTSNYSTFNYSTLLGGFGAAGDPQLQVGQGFWYHTAATAPAIVWSRTFSVNQ